MTGGLSRRRFLAATGVAAGLSLAAGACSDGDDAGGSDPGGQPPPPPPTRRPATTGDLAVADLAARLERLAVDTYGVTLAAAGTRLGSVPPAMAEYLATASAHHAVHLSSWNTMLRGGGVPEVTEPHAGLKPLIDARFAGVTDALGAAQLVLILEDVASQTYNRAIPTLRGKEAIRLAAQIQVVDQQHISVLRYLLGLYPVGSGDVPESRAFQPTERAASG